jgi:hypothetical protein
MHCKVVPVHLEQNRHRIDTTDCRDRLRDALKSFIHVIYLERQYSSQPGRLAGAALRTD